MKHLGDITLIKGNEAPVVDVIIGGSPCQDLSVAGKRAGLAGERSGLFMEQIRVIKEMREHDKLSGRAGVDVRPRYGIWENVPGALSSPGKGHAGEDFAAVLEEFIRVAEPEAPDVHVPEKGWPTSGCFWDEMGKWSVAWRILDAQFWGVPQRRRRIALVADFGGLSAPEILFVRESVSGNIEPGKPKWKETSGDAGEGTGGAVPCTLKIRGGCNGGGKGALIQEYKSATLSTLQDQTLFQPVAVIASCAANAEITDGSVSPCLLARAGTGGNNMPSVAFKAYQKVIDQNILDDQGGSQITVRDDGKSPTLRAEMHGNVPCVMEAHAFEMQAFGQYKDSGRASSLKARDYKDATDLVVAGVNCRNNTEYPEMNGTLQAKANGGFSYNCNTVVRINNIVRRLTPLECERLQGFPDDWTDIGEWVDSKGKKHKEADSPRYKALGNSIAIPPWKWVLKRLCACYERDATMASLFDGIGGFPYIWEQLNGKGSCLWASEIEEFPMAVTKLRFGGHDQ